jgi:Putative adhesin
MNSRRSLIYSLVILLAATGCNIVAERKIVHIDRSWPAAGVTRLEVNEIDGTIKVEASQTDQIVMKAVVKTRVPGKANEENQGFFRTELDGDTLTIGRKHEGRWRVRWGNRNDVSVTYELQVPKTVSLDLQTVNGRISSRGIDGETRATTVNGVVDIEHSGIAEVEAKAVNGVIRAHFLHDFHGATFKTVNGRVTAVLPPSASFSGDFNQVNGDVEAAFPLNIRSHPGSRRVSGEVNGGRYSLHITTVNGDIKVENGGAPPAPPAPSAPAAPPALPAPPTPTAPTPST